jgi:hypothetical protein
MLYVNEFGHTASLQQLTTSQVVRKVWEDLRAEAIAANCFKIGSARYLLISLTEELDVLPQRFLKNENSQSTTLEKTELRER